MGLGAMRTFIRHGISIPDSLAVVGTDAAWSDVVQPPLTVMTQPAAAMGRRAVELLVDRLANPTRPTAPVFETIPVSLIIRQST